MRVNTYYKPTILREALVCMRSGGVVKALAGGTDLIIEMNEGKIAPDVLVDLSAIAELKHIEAGEDGLHVGSMATFSQIASSAVVWEVCPMLAEAAAMVGSPQVRNSGTIGGNLANAATAADTVPALMAADAVAVIKHADGERILPVTEVPTGLNHTCLAPDELICELVIPRHPGCFMAFEKIGRRKALAISRINMGLLLEMDESRIARADVAYGAVGKTAYRVSALETFLRGKLLDDTLIEQAAQLAEEIVTEKLAGRKTTPYKRKIAAAVLRRALTKAKGGAV